MKNTRRCKVCRIQFDPWGNGKVPVCKDPKCILEFHRLKKEKEQKQKVKAEIQVLKEKSKTHSQHQKELQPLINKISALIDKDMNCICCGAKITHLNRPNAGHRFAVGGNNTLRFNLHNIHQNGVCCNLYKGGNLDNYDEGLLKTYGKDYFEYVKWELKGLYKEVKLSIDEIKEIRVKALSIIRRLKSKDLVYSSDERIKLRDEINDEIGVYLKHFSDIARNINRIEHP